MGLFSKIKDNLNHGGVKIDIIGPDRIEKGQTGLQLQVRLTGGDKERTIKSVTASVDRVYLGEDTTSNRNTLAYQDYEQPFSIAAGQTLFLNFDIPLDPSKQSDNQTMQALGSSLAKLGNAFDNMKNRQYMHQLMVSAHIDGIASRALASKKIIWDGNEQPNIRFTIDT